MSSRPEDDDNQAQKIGNLGNLGNLGIPAERGARQSSIRRAPARTRSNKAVLLQRSKEALHSPIAEGVEGNASGVNRVGSGHSFKFEDRKRESVKTASTPQPERRTRHNRDGAQSHHVCK